MADFSVTKIQKVKLDGDPLAAGVSIGTGDVKTPEIKPDANHSLNGTNGTSNGEFVRNGSFRSSKRGSVANRLRAIEEGSEEDRKKAEEDKKRVRRSGEVNESLDLFDYLIQAEDDVDNAKFERQGSLKRRRRKPNLDTLVVDRERAPSPHVESESLSSSPKHTVERRWRSNVERSDVDKALGPPNWRDSPPRSPGFQHLTAPSPLLSGEPVRRVWSIPSDMEPVDRRWSADSIDRNRWSSDSTDKTRWSSSSTDDPKSDPLEDEAAKERARRRLERKKRCKLDIKDVHSARTSVTPSPVTQSANIDSVSKDNTPVVISDPSASQCCAEPVSKSKSYEHFKSEPISVSSVPSSPEKAHISGLTSSGTDSANTQETQRKSQVYRYRNNVDAHELASALRTIEEMSKQSEQGSSRKDSTTTPLVPQEDTSAGIERTRTRLSRRFQSNIEPSAINSVIQQIESSQPKEQDFVQPTVESNDHVTSKSEPCKQSQPEAVHNYVDPTMWRSEIDKTDVDSVIKSIERTGREIQAMAKPGVPVSHANKKKKLTQDGAGNEKSWINRRWRSHLDKTEVQEALRKNPSPQSPDAPVPPPRTTSKLRSSIESGLHILPAQNTEDRKLHKSLSDIGKVEALGDIIPMKERMKKAENSTITEQAWLEHSSGRWKSNIEKIDVDEAFKQMHEQNKLSPSTPTSHPMRPVSTYDNVSDHAKIYGKIHNGGYGKRKDTSTLSLPDNNGSASPDTKRWARYLDDVKLDDNGNTAHANSIPPTIPSNTISKYATLPRNATRHWNIPNDTSEQSSSNANNSPAPLPGAEDVGYYSLDRAGRMRRSLRLVSLRKDSDEAPVLTSALRNNFESKQLDNNVQQFQSKVKQADKTRRQQRFQSLSQRYQSGDDDWVGSPSPGSQRSSQEESFLTADSNTEHLNAINLENKVNEPSHTDSSQYISSPPIDTSHISTAPGHTSIDQQISPRGLKIPDDLSLAKSDTESVASARDEGFDSESMSDPSASQRTSMSSTLESELTGTPTLGRKDYSRQKTDVTEETEEPKNYFARSIDSLVQKQDLAMSSKTEDEDENVTVYSDKTPTSEDNRLDVCGGHDGSSTHESSSDGKTVTNTPEEETQEETWMEYTVERKFSDMTKDEQATLLSQMQTIPTTERPPTPPERTTSMNVTTTRAKMSSRHSTPDRRSLYSKPSKPSVTVTNVRSTDSPSKSRLSMGRTKAQAPPPPTSANNFPVKKRSAAATAAAVTARLSRPKKPSASLAKPAGNLTRHASNSSIASEASTTSTTSKPKNATKKTVRASLHVPAASSTLSRSSSTRSSSESNPPSINFIRGSATRATLPASVFRSNKKAAADARSSKNVPAPIQRSAPIRVSTILSLSRGAKNDSEEDMHSASNGTSFTRPRRSAGMSSASFTSRDLHKNESKVGKIMSKFGKGKEGEEGKPTKPGMTVLSRDVNKPRTKNMPLTKSSPRGSKEKLGDLDSLSKKDRSPSFIKKIIDKSPYRKSMLNKSEMENNSPAIDRKNKITMLRSPTKSSKC